MDQRYTTLREILLALWKYQDREWHDPPATSKELYQSLVGRYPGLTEKDLEDLLPVKQAKGQAPRAPRSTLMYLPPLREYDSKFVPVLHLPHDFSSLDSGIRLPVVLRGRSGGEEVAVGFRFEREKEGHTYYHVQLAPDEPCPSCLCGDWLPKSLPCIPVFVGDPLRLLLSVFLSLYGCERFREFAGRFAAQLPPPEPDQFCSILSNRRRQGPSTNMPHPR